MKRLGLILIALISLLLPVVAQAQATPAPSDGSFSATVGAPVLRLRRAPRLTSSVKGLLTKGEQITVVARDQTGAWLLVLTAEGNGWIDRTYVISTDKPYYLPISHVYPPFTSAVTGEGVNVRQGPNDKYPIITTLPPGTEADVIAVHRSRPVWYEIALEDGTTGWVYQNSVYPPGNLAWTPDDDEPPLAQIATYNLQVHTDADLNSPKLGDARLDSQFVIIGRDYNGNWLQIKGKFGSGWISAKYAIIIGNLNSVPVVAGSAPTILQ